MSKVVMFNRSVNPLTIRILPGIMCHTVTGLPTIKIVRKLTAGVLHATIGVNDQIACILTFLAGKRFGKATNLTTSRQVTAAMTGQDLTGMYINHKADVIPATTAPHVGDIGLPHLVRAGYGHALNQVAADIGSRYCK